MNSETYCPECGSPLPGDALEGLCPQCLMKRGLDTGASEIASADVNADSNKSTLRLADDFRAGALPDMAALQTHLPRIEILEFLGRGGMGVVYKARQKQLDRIVALKVLAPEFAQDPAFSERFSREAKALAKLSHPHIVAVHDFGVTESGQYYFVMEFVEGTNLREVIRAKKLSPSEALAMVPQICEALQFAHEEGIVHRDIKPENILLDKKGRVRIADFGLAKLMGRLRSDDSLTANGQRMGTPHYMAPEQMEKPLSVDHRADIYSLGVVLYEMLTGELPLGRFEPPSHKVQIDVRLDEVVLKTLEKEPGRRYQHVSEIRSDVEHISSNSRSESRQPKSDVRTESVGANRGPKKRVFTTLRILGGVIGIAVGVYALIYAGRVGSPQPGQELKRFPVDSLDGVIAKTDVVFDTAISSDSNGSIRITADESKTIRLYEAGDIDIENAVLTYQARMRTEGVEGKAYIEMWCQFSGGAEYFSKALQSPVSGTTDWCTQTTPFFLKKGENPVNVKLNVTIEGKGSVWIDDIRLMQGALR